jgi:hypothetical protein
MHRSKGDTYPDCRTTLGQLARQKKFIIAETPVGCEYMVFRRAEFALWVR